MAKETHVRKARDRGFDCGANYFIRYRAPEDSGSPDNPRNTSAQTKRDESAEYLYGSNAIGDGVGPYLRIRTGTGDAHKRSSKKADTVRHSDIHVRIVYIIHITYYVKKCYLIIFYVTVSFYG